MALYSQQANKEIKRDGGAVLLKDRVKTLNRRPSMLKLKKINKYKLVAAVTVGAMSMSTSEAFAGTSFNTIAKNLSDSIASMPHLLSAISYMFGIMLGVLGVLKIKDHVENPGQTPLKDGAIRLAAGGGLFALPLIYDAMNNAISSGANSQGDVQATLTAITFG
jgi:hypothetical protein